MKFLTLENTRKSTAVKVSPACLKTQPPTTRESTAENGAQRAEGKSLTAFQVERNHLETSLSQDLF